MNLKNSGQREYFFLIVIKTKSVDAEFDNGIQCGKCENYLRIRLSALEHLSTY